MKFMGVTKMENDNVLIQGESIAIENLLFWL